MAPISNEMSRSIIKVEMRCVAHSSGLIVTIKKERYRYDCIARYEDGLSRRVCIIPFQNSDTVVNVLYPVFHNQFKSHEMTTGIAFEKIIVQI